eukprot:4740659-Amphidinium_carterae.2
MNNVNDNAILLGADVVEVSEEAESVYKHLPDVQSPSLAGVASLLSKTLYQGYAFSLPDRQTFCSCQ